MPITMMRHETTPCTIINLVEHATDEKTLTEWAHHHMFLNDLAPIEHQIEWLSKVGFKVQKDFLKMNTALLFCFRN